MLTSVLLLNFRGYEEPIEHVITRMLALGGVLRGRLGDADWRSVLPAVVLLLAHLCR